MIDIQQDDLSGEPTRALLALHLDGMRANSPPGGVFALDLSGLMARNVTVWTAWIDGTLAGIGALKILDDGGGEVKSMRTHPDHARKGVGRALLVHIIGEARRRGVKRLSLETGSNAAFEPALALYRAFGFVDGPAYASYEPNPFSRFMHLTL